MADREIIFNQTFRIFSIILFVKIWKNQILSKWNGKTTCYFSLPHQYLLLILIVTLSSASRLESRRQIHIGRETNLCTWTLTRSTSILVKQWSRNMRSLVCSRIEIWSGGATVHFSTAWKNPENSSGLYWNAVQAGTLSRNFSFTITMIDMMCARVEVSALKFGQR